jgi:hypothetical protein
MTFQLIGLLSAAALAATGLGATDETRSAQSLPAQNLAVAQSATGAAGKLHAVRHLADASGPSDEGSCEHDGGHWDNDHCRRGSWAGSGVKLLILGGTAAGIVVAVTESNHKSVSY